MSHVSSLPLHPFALPEWRPWTRPAPVPARAPAEPSHAACAVRLGGFVGALWRVCDGMTASTEARQQLRFGCIVDGEPPAPQLDLLIRLATFLVSDAADACATTEATGRFDVLVERRRRDVVLSVEHNGWSRPPAVIGGRSLAWARRIADAHSGTLSRRIEWDRTLTRITLPVPGPARGPDPGRHST